MPSQTLGWSTDYVSPTREVDRVATEFGQLVFGAQSRGDVPVARVVAAVLLAVDFRQNVSH